MFANNKFMEKKNVNKNSIEDQIIMNKYMSLRELELLDLNISSSIDEKDEIYNAIMDKYESIWIEK